MVHDQPIQLHLAPVADDRTIAGRLRDEQGADHQFTSWLGLLSLLEEARARARDDGDR